MNTILVKQALDIFDEAMQLDPSARPEFVNRRCERNEDLRAEVTSLLSCDGQLSIEIPPTGETRFDWPTEILPSDRYKIGGEIARGGMGIILRASDQVLNRDVAIKVLLKDHQNQPDILRRFFSEARVGARLQHPGIAPVYDLGSLPEHGPFFAMKLVGGHTLATILANREQTELDLSHLLTIFEQLCQTVSYVHSHQIIHRDLKPANVMVGNFGEVQLMDWGLAKQLSSDGDATPDQDLGSNRESIDAGSPSTDALGSISDVESDSNVNATPLTRFGLVMGTPDYMPPEQAAGEQGKTTDVFSLGAILCEVLTGKPPYDAPTPGEVYEQAVRGHIHQALDRLDRCGCDEQLVNVARRCLSPASQDRYPDAGFVAREIAHYRETTAARLHQAELNALQANTVAREERKRKRVSVALAVSVLILGLSGMTGWWWVSSKSARYATQLVKTEKEGAARAEAHAYRTDMVAAFLEVENKRFDRALVLLEDAPIQFRNWEWQYLHSFIEQSQRVYTHDVRDVEMLGLVRGTDHLRFIETDSTSRLLNRWTGEELSRKSVVVGQPLALGPDINLVLTRSDDLVLWNASSGDVVQRFAFDAKDSIRSTVIAPGGSQIAVLTHDRLLRLFESKSGGLVKSFQDCQCNPEFDAGGEMLVCIVDNTIQFWSTDDIREIRPQIKFASDRVIQSVRLNREGTLLATQSPDDVRIWNLETGEEQQFSTTTRLSQIKFNNTGKQLATILIDGTIQRWDLGQSKPILIEEFRSPGMTMTWNREISFDDPVFCTLLAEPSHADPNNSEFWHRDIRLWQSDGTSTRKLTGHSSFVYPVVLSPDGERIASGSWDGTVRLWDSKTSEPIATLTPNCGAILCLAFDSAGERLLAGSSGGKVTAWSMSTGETLAQIQLDDKCYSLAFSSNDASLIVGHGGVSVLDGNSLERTRVLVPGRTPGDEGHMTEIIRSPVDDSFVTFSGKGAWAWGNKITIWDSSKLSQRSSFDAPFLTTSSVYSNDGTHLVLGHANGLITIWNLANLEKPTLQIEAHREEVLSLCFLNETRLASSSKDGKILIWDVETGQQLGILLGHEDYVYSLAFSPDNQQLVSGSGDSTVRIWETSPLADRLDAIRESESCRQAAQILVEELFSKTSDYGVVSSTLQNDRELSETVRRVALNCSLRRSIARIYRSQKTASSESAR